MLPISATIISKNAGKTLTATLDALQDFADIVVLDNGSSDDTLTIAARYGNVRIVESAFLGFGALKNLAAEHARHDWIFSIDSDEVPDAALRAALSAANLRDRRNIYRISRLNHYRGRPIRSCGWYPDRIARMYHREHTRFSNRPVHEALQLPDNSAIHDLPGELLHYSYANASELIAKMQHYSSLFAEYRRFTRSSSVATAIAHGVGMFMKSYILRGGIRDGQDGWVISVSQALGSYYKYIKLLEANQMIRISVLLDDLRHLPDTQQAAVHETILLGRDVDSAEAALRQASGDYLLYSRVPLTAALLAKVRKQARRGSISQGDGWRGGFVEDINGDFLTSLTK